MDLLFNGWPTDLVRRGWVLWAGAFISFSRALSKSPPKFSPRSRGWPPPSSWFMSEKHDVVDKLVDFFRTVFCWQKLTEKGIRICLLIHIFKVNKHWSIKITIELHFDGVFLGQAKLNFSKRLFSQLSRKNSNSRNPAVIFSPATRWILNEALSDLAQTRNFDNNDFCFLL